MPRNFLNKLFFTIIATMVVGGVTWGSIWSTGWTGAAPAALLVFGAIWLFSLYAIWVWD